MPLYLAEKGDDDSLSSTVPTRWGIELHRELARGEFCKVHLAFDKVANKAFVLKKFASTKHANTCLSREIEVFALLQQNKASEQQFIISMQWFDIDHSFLALELCDGGDLYELISQERLTESDVIFYGAEIAAAIGFLHTNYIFHGDIKSENVGITAEGHVRLFNFDLSHVLSPLENVDAITGRLTVKTKAGTLCFAAPEIIKYRQCGLEADWWSFGVLLYELLFTSLPWEGDTSYETARMIAVEPLLWNGDQIQSTSMKAISLLQDLLACKDPALRLGYEEDIKDIKAHMFFESIDWCALERQEIAPPFEALLLH